MEILEDTRRRMYNFIHTLKLPYEFHLLLQVDKVGKLDSVFLLVKRDDAMAIHWLHHSLYDIKTWHMHSMFSTKAKP